MISWQILQALRQPNLLCVNTPVQHSHRIVQQVHNNEPGSQAALNRESPQPTMLLQASCGSSAAQARSSLPASTSGRAFCSPAPYRQLRRHEPARRWMPCPAQLQAERGDVLDPVEREVAAFAPATVANLGPGFDWLGCAVQVCARPLTDSHCIRNLTELLTSAVEEEVEELGPIRARLTKIACMSKTLRLFGAGRRRQRHRHRSAGATWKGGDRVDYRRRRSSVT